MFLARTIAMKSRKHFLVVVQTLSVLLIAFSFPPVFCVQRFLKNTPQSPHQSKSSTFFFQSKATISSGKSSIHQIETFTSKPKIEPNHNEMFDTEKMSKDEKEPPVGSLATETTESVPQVSKIGDEFLETHKPRQRRSTAGGRATTKVFLDPFYSDYSLSWITRDDSNIHPTRGEGQKVGHGSDGSATPTGTRSSTVSSSSSSSSSSFSSLFPSMRTQSYSQPTYRHNSLEKHPVEDVVLEIPSRPTTASSVPYQHATIAAPLPGSGRKSTLRTACNLRRMPEEVDRKRVLYIGGIFELSKNSHSESAQSELDAALLAICHVNEKQVVPGYHLQLVYNDSKCDTGVGTDVFYDMIYQMGVGRHLTMVMGSACAEVTKTLAELVPYWNLILISYAATSPALGDREKYQTFFRLALADSALVPARRMFINSMGWKTVAVLYEDIEKYTLAMNAIGADFALNNITISASLSFKDAALEIPEQLQELKNLDVRIILAAFSVATARQVFCQAYHQGLYGRRYVWLLMGGFKTDGWWRESRGTNCTPAQLARAVNGCFAVVSLNTLLGNAKSVANLTTTEFEEAYHASNGSMPMSFFAATTYDTVWTIALTLRTAISRWRLTNQSVPHLHATNYSSLAPIRDTYLDIIRHSHFNGVSGPVSFKGSDREGVSVIYQLQGGNFSRVAIHYPDSPRLDFDCDGCRPIVWQGGRIPRDKKIVVPRQKTIDAAIFYISAACSGSGIFLALIFLQYNLYHRKLKFIKLSSPKLNNVAVIGCILVYTTVVLMGLDDRTMPPHVFSVVCTVRVFLLAAGFSLAFGAMFAKTFRVHQIFTRAHHGLVKNKLLRDRHLLFLIGGLLVLDSGVICVWVVVDPMRRHVTNLTMESSEEDEDLVYLTQLATCHSQHLQKWMGIFYAYKGLLLLFGVYMAWETRHVKIPALNDSQYIGFNVYNVVLMSVCVVVLSNILSSQPTLSYTIESAFMVVSTTVTLCLLFVPKIYVIVTSGGDPVIASTGILVEANTRRFVVDDKKEIYYRAEVQNRVYKRELVALDQEMSRLETLLELPMEDYPKLTEELLYLLPESKIDSTPAFQRRRNTEFIRCNSISDGGEGVTYGREDEDKDSVLTFMCPGGGDPGHGRDPGGGRNRLKPGVHTAGKRYSAHEAVTESAFRKLRRLSRSLSIGPCSHLKGRKRGGGGGGGGGGTCSSRVPDKLDHFHFNDLSLGAGGGGGDGGDTPTSLPFASPPLSPAGFPGNVGKARFAAALGEELAYNSDVLFGGGGYRVGCSGGGVGGSVGRGEIDGRLLHAPNTGFGRLRSYSASTSCDHVTTIDKITQTNFDSPAKRHVGRVFHVDRLEVIEMDENLPSSREESSLWVNVQSDPLTRGSDEAHDDMVSPHSGAGSDERRIRVVGKTSQLSRPKSFPEKLDSCCSRSLNSPRKGVSVHFSPYNEVHFVHRADAGVNIFPDTSHHSSTTSKCPSIPLSQLSHDFLNPDSQSHSSSAHEQSSSHVQNSAFDTRTEGESVASRSDDAESSTPDNNVGRSNLRVVQCVIENERRKRIFKLQHDLQRIQRELHDLNNLEYDITEL